MAASGASTIRNRYGPRSAQRDEREGKGLPTNGKLPSPSRPRQQVDGKRYRGLPSLSRPRIFSLASRAASPNNNDLLSAPFTLARTWCGCQSRLENGGNGLEAKPNRRHRPPLRCGGVARWFWRVGERGEGAHTCRTPFAALPLATGLPDIVPFREDLKPLAP